MIKRWRLSDPATGEAYVFAQNPSKMTSLTGEKAISVEPTLYAGALMYEGSRVPQRWSFSGSLRTREQLDALTAWVYGKNSRVGLSDHFGRQLQVVLVGLDAAPARKRGVYWFHEYTVTALVLEVGAASIDTAAAGWGVA